MANFNEAIEEILTSEGGYVNDLTDAGGETKFGISKRSYPNVDIRNLTIDQAKAIYRRDFWDKIGGDQLRNQEIANLLVDSAVNEGVVPAIKRAEKIVGLPETGHISTELISKLNQL
jgi:lysozyme family protein